MGTLRLDAISEGMGGVKMYETTPEF
jgi:hypothetical protein